METLREKQSRFVLEFCRLVLWAYDQGYKITWGEAYRTEEMAELNARRGVGTLSSLHRDRLAIDINLFKDGVWLKDTESHRPLGEKWESMGSDHRWGGRFNDGNHYSIEYQGRK